LNGYMIVINKYIDDEIIDLYFFYLFRSQC
jgi:hypothetical protein